MAALAETPEQKAFKDLLDWSNAQPLWQRDALRRLCSKVALDASDLAELLEICRGTSTNAEPLQQKHLPKPSGVSGAVNLLAIHSTKHVNALATGQRLTFTKTGLTVIYGDNGSGKSGYARVLKRSCRARVPEKAGKQERVLPNVYSKDAGPPQAIIEYSIGGQNRTCNWTDGQSADSELASVSVFDSRTASVHVDEENGVAYTPAPLRMLAQLAEAAGSLKSLLDAESVQISASYPAWVKTPLVKSATAVGQFMQKLAAKTTDAELDNLAAYSEQDESERQRLVDALKASISDLIGQSERALERTRRMIAFVDKIDIELSPDRVTAFFSARDAMQRAIAAERQASQQEFESEPVAGVGSDPWKAMWEAARAFSLQEAYKGSSFPHTHGGANCVLCHQSLDENAASRLQRFEQFVKGDLKAKADLARSQLEGAVESIIKIHVNRQLILEGASFIAAYPDMQDIGDQFRRLLICAKWRSRQVLRAQDTKKAFVELPDSQPLKAGLERLSQTIASDLQLLRSPQQSQFRLNQQNRLEEIQAKKWLNDNISDVRAQRDRLKAIAALTELKKQTQTTAITTKSTGVAKALVTDALRAEFSKEASNLGIADREVELRQSGSKQGVPQFKVGLMRKQDAQLGAILSEGEFRCAAVAAFLAELATSNDKSAIVFDDPVSSLDHMNREKVANRLAEEAQHRQVVVFTHDIAFLFYLENARKDLQVQLSVRSVGRGKDAAGFCNEESPIQARSVDQTISSIQRQLENQKIQHEQGQQDQWSISIASFSDQLRKAWERVVEDAVTPVIRRLSNKVYTNGLIKLTVLTEEDVKNMRDGYGRCSKLKHSDADVLNPPLPTPDAVQAEIDALKTWTASLRARQDAAKLA